MPVEFHHVICGMTVTPPLNRQVIYKTDLAFCASYKDGKSATDLINHTLATRHDSKRLLSDKHENT